MMQIIGTYAEFKKFMKKKPLDNDIDEAINVYLESGGVIKVNEKHPLKIIYPGKIKLQEQLSQTEKKENFLEEQIKIWKTELRKINTDNFLGGFTRTINPIYWQHLLQMAANPEYRKSFDIVDPPIELLNKPRYKKVIDMFVKNPEYRERLVEARTSILGKMRDSIKESAHKSDEFKKDTITARLNKLEKEKQIHTQKKEALETLIKNSERFF